MYNTIGAFLGESENNCVITDTRANLIALRNAGSLVVGCHYVLTDHVQGRLVAGTTITLHADSSNEFSENVTVNTTYDNEGWRGIYDIDRALVLELQDNRNNIVRGFNGTEVSNFDWGNISYTNVTVDNATLTADIGNTATKQNVTIDKIANVNITGFTGNLNNITFSTAVTANFTNANGTWRYSTIRGGGNFNVSGYTGGGDNYYNTIDAASNINFSNSSSQVILRQNEITAGTITHTGVSTGTLNVATTKLFSSTINHAAGALNLTIQGNSEIVSGANINHLTGTMTLNNVQARSSTIQNNLSAGAITNLNQVYVLQGSTVNNSSTGTLSMTQSTLDILSIVARDSGSTGTLTVNASKVIQNGYVRHLSTNTGNTVVSNSEIVGSSYIYNYAATTINATRLYMTGASSVNANNGSNGVMNLSDTYIDAQSAINKLAASTSGTMTINTGTRLQTNSFIQTAGTGNLTVTSSMLNGGSGINVTAGNRGYTFTRLVQSGVSRANLSGTGAVTDTINELEMGYRGALNISCSGAANNMNYCTINGLSGAVTLRGTTGGKTMNRLKFFDGSLTVNNNPNSGTYQFWTISDAGVVTLTNHAAGDTFNYIDVSNQSNVTINKTAASGISGLQVLNNGSYNMTGNVGNVSRVIVEQGTLSHSGGTLTNVSKKMVSTFTVTGGTQNNVHHWNTTNKTTSVNNTNRVDYLGVLSSVPIL